MRFQKHSGADPFKLLLAISRISREVVISHIDMGISPEKLFLDAMNIAIGLGGIKNGPWKSFDLRSSTSIFSLEKSFAAETVVGKIQVIQIW